MKCVFKNNRCIVCDAVASSDCVHRLCGGRVTRSEKRWLNGPGTELSRLLKKFGIEPTPTCACRAKAAEMDAWGPDECAKSERIEEVVAVMREEAAASGLLFSNFAARLLIRRAIANARRAASTACTPTPNTTGNPPPTPTG